MAQYGKLQGILQDNQGNPISNGTVEVRRQGAFVTSTQAGPTYTVNDPGGITVGDQVRVNTTTGPTRNVSAVTATTITTSGAGLGTLNNNDRITIQSTLQTLYADAQGAETKANPLTSDANGYWFCWVPVVPFDLLESGTGFGTRLKTDVLPEGNEFVASNLFQGAAAIAYRRISVRTLTSGKLLTLENPDSSEKFSVDYAGNVIALGTLGVTGNASFSGNLAVTGDLTVDDITMDDLTADDISVGDLTVSGAISLPAGGLETADLAANAVTKTAEGVGNTDQALAAGAAYAAVANVTVTFTPFSTASEIIVMGVCPVTTDAVAGDVSAQIKDGGTVIHETTAVQAFAGNRFVTIPLLARQTGLSGSHTWTMEAKCSVAAHINSSSTNLKAKIVVMEFKK